MDTLCVELGFCLPPAMIEHLVASPPESSAAFTRTVFAAEGLDPDAAPRRLLRQVNAVIAAAYPPTVTDRFGFRATSE